MGPVTLSLLSRNFLRSGGHVLIRVVLNNAQNFATNDYQTYEKNRISCMTLTLPVISNPNTVLYDFEMTDKI